MAGMNELLGKVIDRLEHQGIDYCHWKGNFRLERILAGEDDFDLLVPGTLGNRVPEILGTLGFKAAIPRVEPACAESAHFYGYDAGADLMVHIHLYSQVLTGENFVDSHQLPFETMLVRETTKHHGVRVPTKAAESIVLVLKTYIRYGSMLDLVALVRRPREKMAQLAWLDPKAYLGESQVLLAEFCPEIDAGLYEQCVRGLVEPASPLLKFRLAVAVRRRLKRYERTGWIRRVGQKFGYLTRKMVRDIGVRHRGKILADGGRVISIVEGGDGESSSVVQDLSRWLGKVFLVTTIDARAPARSLVSFSMRPFLSLARQIHAIGRATGGTGNGPYSEHRFRGITEAIEAVLLARDRRRALIRAQKAAQRGRIVVINTFLPTLTDVGARDSAEYRRPRGGIVAATLDYLARLESKHERQMPRVDARVNVGGLQQGKYREPKLAMWEALRS